IRLVAPTNSTILITGENGTGKELVARAIHYRSARQNRPLIEVNCAAIPEELIESELFGHEKGAFTGAVGKKPGRFDLANGGTLFLDEIGDMSLKTQAKVLRILEEQRFERVGGSKTISVDVRIIAATNKNLKKEIEEGRFREDLFYRLNVIPIKVPPLRERLEDIPLLVEDFLDELARESGLGRKKITEDAISILQQYHWPGNVRELRNLIERLVILTPGETIDKQQLLRLFDAEIPDSNKKLSNIYELENLREARAYFEREFIRRKLEKNNWNISLTAQKIGIERTHLHRKMKAYGLGAD
ncbi:MAG TPA: sigma-54-dependent Fis family transcriptional regulator, partial [Deltaproteobacteria bacterium]|nr:sigma-54-dependent Fis family transcriptional regulator [Deltaproteobacteria bacterium]